VKPDGVQRALIGEVISRLERRGLRLVAAKFMEVSKELAETHYGIHKGKPFYDGLIEYIISAPVMAMVWEDPTRSPPSVRQWARRVPPKPRRVRFDMTLPSKWDGISLTLRIQQKMERVKLRCGSRVKSWLIGRGKWIGGCLRSRRD